MLYGKSYGLAPYLCLFLQTCQSQYCKPCTNTNQCTAPGICENGGCSTRRATSCVSDYDCPPPFSCWAGECGAQCYKDRDCPGDDVCRNGYCGPECKVDADCSVQIPPLKCGKGGSCGRTCVTAADCPPEGRYIPPLPFDLEAFLALLIVSSII